MSKLNSLKEWFQGDPEIQKDIFLKMLENGVAVAEGSETRTKYTGSEDLVSLFCMGMYKPLFLDDEGIKPEFRDLYEGWLESHRERVQKAIHKIMLDQQMSLY